MILTPPLGWLGTDHEPDEMALMTRLNPKTVMMMGENPALPPMPDKPTLHDFFTLRFGPVTRRHLTVSAKRGLKVDAVTVWNFLRREGKSFKKNGSWG